MSIVNRRNAVVGWLAIKGGKTIARRKMKRVGGRLVSRRGGDQAKSAGRA